MKYSKYLLLIFLLIPISLFAQEKSIKTPNLFEDVMTEADARSFYCLPSILLQVYVHDTSISKQEISRYFYITIKKQLPDIVIRELKELNTDELSSSGLLTLSISTWTTTPKFYSGEIDLNLSRPVILRTSFMSSSVLDSGGTLTVSVWDKKENFLNSEIYQIKSSIDTLVANFSYSYMKAQEYQKKPEQEKLKDEFRKMGIDPNQFKW